MARHSIPTAKYRTFSASQFDEAVEFVKTCGFQVVLKADGLAAGKGVLIPTNTEEAIAGLRTIMVDNTFGAAGAFWDLISCSECYVSTFNLRQSGRY